MTTKRALLIAIGLVAVFAAIAISVVDERDDFEPAMDRSFEAVMNRTDPPPEAESLGCTRDGPNIYDCTARFRSKTGSTPVDVTYRILLGGTCWSTLERDPLVDLPPRLDRPRGCLAA